MIREILVITITGITIVGLMGFTWWYLDKKINEYVEWAERYELL